MDIVEKETGVVFYNAASPGRGLWELLKIDVEKIKKVVDVSQIEHVVIQKPVFFRYPWYCREENYNKREATHGFFALSRIFSGLVMRMIFKAESKLLKIFRESFPQARFAFWRYWIYDTPVVHERFTKYENRLDSVAEKLGMTAWGKVVPDEEILKMQFSYNDVGWKSSKQVQVYENGWILRPGDAHPTRKHNLLVAKLVKEWLNE
jgi:hypothetical protein